MFFNKKYTKSNTELLENSVKIKDVVTCDTDNDIIIDNMLDEIIAEFIIRKHTFINAVERGITSKDELKTEVFKFIDIKTNKLSKDDKEYLLSSFETYIWGYGQLQELIDDPDITDIRIIDYNNIRIKKFGRREKSSVAFKSRESMKTYINFIATKNKAILSEINAIQIITDKTSSKDFILRINICSEFINTVDYPYLVIRKLPKKKKDLKQLNKLNMFNNEIQNYLTEGIENDLSMLVVGKGASGKTTLLNALIDMIPFYKSGLVIQEAEELFSDIHPDIMFQKVKYAKGESKIQYTLKDLSINGLLTDLDYFIIGEIKGDEAIDMINAIYTGHVGLSSVHGSSAEEGTNKIIHYMKYSSDMKEEMMLQMVSYLDTIIFMKDFKTAEIVEIEGFDNENKRLLFNKVFEYQIKEVNGELVGTFVKLNDSCEKVKNKMLYSKFRKNV